MGVAFQPRSMAFRPLGISASRVLPRGHLPPEIAFLREYGVGGEVLRAAAGSALAEGVDAREALLAGGGITDTLYYRSLAHLLDAPFRTDSASVSPRTDALRAVRDGRVRLADGSWLLAPAGAALRLLLDGARVPDVLPRRIAITTPAHLEALVLRRAGTAVARRASEALPTLQPSLCARGALDARAAGAALGILLAATTLFLLVPAILAMLVGAIFLAAVGLRWLVCVAALPERRTGPAPPRVADADLPRYTVLVPLYGEAGMVPLLIRRLGALDYPAAKLEILILVEADDMATRAALAAAPKPPRMRMVVVPPGMPRTKPRALNVGLALARGALITVYDAEDRPHPEQLRAAAARYAAASPRLACLQGRLAIVHGTRLLPRLFALEYAGLFDLYNVGLGRLRLPMPLGGTSNHFRAAALRAVGGWDAWNVTEDADLGLRLARFGYDIGVLDSVTYEEAPVRLPVWLKQRRRWTKGWMQVALVLARDRSARRDLGPGNAAAVALMLVNLVIGPLATPPVLALAAWQLCRGGLDVRTAMLALAVPAVAIVSSLWCGWAGLRARRLDALAPYLPLLLPYQLLIACAAWGGLWDLVRRPYHWRKTPHGTEVLNRSLPAAPPRRQTGRLPPMPG